MVEFCCCCIPIRLGTIILAAIVMATSISDMSLILTQRDIYSGMDNGLRILFSVLYGITALVAFFGIVGSITSNRRAVRLFSTTLWFIVIVCLVLRIAILVEMFQHKQEHIDACVGNATSAVSNELSNVTSGAADNSFIGNSVNNTASSITNTVHDKSISACEKIITIKLWLTVIGYALLAILMFYFAGVTSRFARQLETEYRHQKLSSHTGYRGARPSSSRTSVAMSSV